MNTSNEVKIGVTVIVAVIVAFLGYRFMSDVPIFRQSHEIVTTFNRVDGLNSGNVVYLNGVKIGSVRSIRLQPDNTVNVVLSIELDIEIPQGSIAYLTSIGLLDSKAIVIERSSSGEPVPDGGEIRGVYMDTMMETLSSRGQDLGDDISESFVELNRFLMQLNATFVDSTRTNINQSLANAEAATRTISEMIESNRGELEQAVSSASHAMGQIDTLATDNRARIDSLLMNLEQTSNELRVVSGELDQTVDYLNEILGKINAGEGSLGRMVNDPSLYNNTDSLSVELRKLITDINNNPGRYLRHMRLIDLF